MRVPDNKTQPGTDDDLYYNWLQKREMLKHERRVLLIKSVTDNQFLAIVGLLLFAVLVVSAITAGCMYDAYSRSLSHDELNAKRRELERKADELKVREEAYDRIDSKAKSPRIVLEEGEAAP